MAFKDKIIGNRLIRKYIVEKWMKIDERKRFSTIKIFASILNYLVNAALISIPVSIFFDFSYFECVVSISIILPFFEHYYVWLRRDWKEDVEK